MHSIPSSFLPGNGGRQGALSALLVALCIACQPPTPATELASGGPLDAGLQEDASDETGDGAELGGLVDGGVAHRSDAGLGPGTDPSDAGIELDAGADGGPAGNPANLPPPLSGCAQQWQDLAARGGPSGIFGERGADLLPDCVGTRLQQYSDVERVVFVGDSVTVGTPPANLASDASGLWSALGGFFSDIVTDVDETYRSRLADHLADRFGLDAPGFTWRLWDPFDQGEALQRKSGDFWNCARWGSKTDDLWTDGEQIANCFPPAQRDKKTLVVFTVGGNDLVDFVQMSASGDPDERVWQRAEEAVWALEQAVAHLKDPNTYPAGNLVVFATPFEYTDWSGEISSCAAASASGLSELSTPDLLRDIMDWLGVEYLRIAETHGADLIFLLEAFCGHGFQRDNPAGPCYRGEDAERWFDLTCIHPNAAGHAQILERFQAVIGE